MASACVAPRAAVHTVTLRPVPPAHRPAGSSAVRGLPPTTCSAIRGAPSLRSPTVRNLRIASSTHAPPVVNNQRRSPWAVRAVPQDLEAPRRCATLIGARRPARCHRYRDFQGHQRAAVRAAAATGGVEAPAEAETSRGGGEFAADAVRGDEESFPFRADGQAGDERFEWRSAWYAVGVADDLDATRPHGVTVLGRPMVLWRDESATWRCFLDECPHRLVPLSEGRIDEQGRLQCSYHGWAFGSDGTCGAIPQAAPEANGKPPRALQSPRACAVAFPTKEHLGVLFVWPDERGWEQAQQTPVPGPPGVNADGELSGFTFTRYTRLLPYSYEMLAENFADPAHLPFAHHGLGHLRRSMGEPMKQIGVADVSIKGFHGPLHDFWMPSYWSFQAPSFICYDRKFPLKKPAPKPANGEAPPVTGTLYICLYMTPCEPGQSLAVVLQGSNGGARRMNLPPWVSHLFMHNIFDSDSYFLHGQDIALANRLRAKQAELKQGVKGTALASAAMGETAAAAASAAAAESPVAGDASTDSTSALRGRLWQSAYYMPTDADLFIVALRQWLGKYAGGGVQYPPHIDPLAIRPLPKVQALDRSTTHTANCRHCSAALQKLQIGKIVLPIVALFAGLVAVVPSGALGLGWRAALGVVAVGAAAGAWKVGDLVRQFTYTGWDHASTE
eukprot:TRINITY_DN8683_c0_g1_i4.p1 TRINITY_DN8683_c0_g1~~TRINITY_DN8683_c0_g1_i4.p1  ORF type:complete len:673 (-),score=-55.16 TRINITY_DN8683_c0_g1_i4:33-2051(-)